MEFSVFCFRVRVCFGCVFRVSRDHTFSVSQKPKVQISMLIIPTPRANKRGPFRKLDFGCFCGVGDCDFGLISVSGRLKVQILRLEFPTPKANRARSVSLSCFPMIFAPLCLPNVLLFRSFSQAHHRNGSFGSSRSLARRKRLIRKFRPKRLSLRLDWDRIF